MRKNIHIFHQPLLLLFLAVALLNAVLLTGLMRRQLLVKDQLKDIR